MTSKTALVFGWKGQDGSLITKSLLNQKFHVIGLSKQNSLNRNNKLSLTIEKDVQKENGDINDFDVISRLISKYMPDEIYNLAAQSFVYVSFYTPEQTSDVNGLNSGSFQDIFNQTATEVGSTVRSSQMEAQDAKASRDEAMALEDAKSGVSLDEEASSLIQFQQAFSANARIIQTARELFDSLLRVVSQ